ncbi:MAG: lipase maturation factor family protein, partial [Bdellovibrionales bacterium]|nr:lipase maturation factor family protein [Bdellovibrionales bacterium]NQZ19658.1 lipase maturation factor family protein [Bdellovibrionales bacterium]
MALILFLQGPSLIGPEGLSPVRDIVNNVLNSGRTMDSLFFQYTSFLLFSSSNFTIKLMAFFMGLSGAILILGYCNWAILILLWFLQLSLVNGGGLFYGFGWETMMLEMTFMSLFFIHPWRLNLMSKKYLNPYYWSFWPLLWMMFRLMLGAGLIKVRGDTCWLNFTCMDYHYQTQPNPHWLSWYYHYLPTWFHRFEVGATHFYELIVPITFLLTRKFRQMGALLIIAFQITLISTGNLAFLNWQTIVLAIVGLDDQFLKKLSIFKFSATASWRQENYPSLWQKRLTFVFIVGVLILSYRPVKNMISPQQRMNQSYDSL